MCLREAVQHARHLYHGVGGRREARAHRVLEVRHHRQLLRGQPVGSRVVPDGHRHDGDVEHRLAVALYAILGGDADVLALGRDGLGARRVVLDDAKGVERHAGGAAEKLAVRLDAVDVWLRARALDSPVVRRLPERLAARGAEAERLHHGAAERGPQLPRRPLRVGRPADHEDAPGEMHVHLDRHRRVRAPTPGK